MRVRLEDLKILFIVSSLVGVLALSSPVWSTLLSSRPSESFSELYVLGSNRTIGGYPFNVRVNETYTIYLGVGNHMGSSRYYVLYVKFRNQTGPLPNSTAEAPSSLPPLYEYRVVIPDGGVWETPLTFSFPRVSWFEDKCLVEAITINGVTFNVDRMAVWDVNASGYYYQLFVKLWIYDQEDGAFKFHNRFVGLWLNATASG